MKKISENIIIKQRQGVLQLIQTGQDFTYIEYKQCKDQEDAYACVDATKFTALYDDKSSELFFGEDCLTIITGRSKGLLPYMKEFGVFSANKELSVDKEVTDSFSADYSDIDLDLTEATDQFSYILFNRNFVCRYLYNTLSFYGEMPKEWYNITPKQFKLLKSLSNCLIEIHGDALVASSNSVELVLKLYSPVINLSLIERFFNVDPSVSFNLHNIDFKKLKVFLKDADVFNLKRVDNTIKLSTLDYNEEFSVDDFSSDGPINLNIFKKDLENLQGFIRVFFASGINYIISNPEQNKTVLFTCER